MSSHHHRILLTQHARLRVLVSAMKRAAAAVLARGEPLSPAAAHLFDRSIEALAAEMSAHLVTEETLLRPALLRSPSGQQRLEHLQVEHDRERAYFDELLPRHGKAPPEDQARYAIRLAEELAEHLEAEERDLYPAVFADAEASTK
ncbi:MAG: hemerythrin domain-containing protein [Myxococcales bacterium]